MKLNKGEKHPKHIKYSLINYNSSKDEMDVAKENFSHCERKFIDNLRSTSTENIKFRGISFTDGIQIKYDCLTVTIENYQVKNIEVDKCLQADNNVDEINQIIHSLMTQFE